MSRRKADLLEGVASAVAALTASSFTSDILPNTRRAGAFFAQPALDVPGPLDLLDIDLFVDV